MILKNQFLVESDLPCGCGRASCNLIEAAEENCLGCCERYLYQAGAQTLDGKTALMAAASADATQAVQFLLYREAGKMDCNGKTALMYAAEAGASSCVPLLMRYEC